ncbi:alpha-ketoglutarate decarboxylase [Maribacter halichondriae]|uniref:alpha-ketoglutarate decarboxylase n=1 Tax=Maribacter halichondriae TaxID=2980554 RepID=UPI0023590FCA|nr:alpha-ketoglutarate decarboxylase [Maribacter sp. Hal144]
MNFTKILLGLVFLMSGALCSAQQTKAKSDFWNHVRFGGGLGLGFTNGGFNGSIAPSAIYQATDNFAVGTSLSFNYAKFNDNKLLAYGGSVLTLFNPIQFIQLSAEFEELRVSRTIAAIPNAIKDNYWSPALFLGLGYTDRNFTVGIRYDVLYDNEKSIYANAWMPFVRVYF